MTAFYIIVQYVPDPVTDERLNVGVLTFGDGKVRARFLGDWRRVAEFGRKSDVSFLADAVQALAASSESDIRSALGSWADVLQLTEPRGSLLSPDELLVDIAERFLRSKTSAVKAARNHAQAASETRRRVKDALVLRFGKEGAALVKLNRPMDGAHAHHQLSVGIENGRLIGGAFALSFEVERALEREIRATAFSAEDVRQKYPDLPLVVAALPPRDETKELFFFARDLFPQFGVRVVVDDEIGEWASNVVSTEGVVSH